VAIRIEDGRIVAVGAFTPGAAGTVIDRTKDTCLPGLIDAHAHVLIKTDDYQVDHLRRSSAYKALRGLNVVQQMLQSGWTTVRILGDADLSYAHLDVRTAIQEGMFVGPRITGAGHYFSITGGGGDLNFIAPEHDVAGDGLVVDGVDAVRKAVREEIKHGSDWIKVLASGAMMSAGNDPNRAHYSPEELRAIVDEATRLGVPVASHAHSAAGIHAAVLAGARTIEHGTFVDDEGIKLMKEKGVYLVPTLYVGDYYLNEQPGSEAQSKMNELTRRYRAQHVAAVGKAIRAGVHVGVGTDYVGFPVKQGVRELAVLVEAGMTPMQAIQAATRVNSELLGWQDSIGTVEPGKLADIIAVRGDPLVDLSVLENVSFVMLGGREVSGR
jgi:imidazolonepropionase-like amidohydrolase